MAKFTVIGDLHLTHSNMYKAEKLFNIVESLQNPCIWLGDELHKRGYIEANCLNMLFNYFENSKLEHLILIGNHTWTDANCTEHSLQTLKALKSVTIVDRPLQRGKVLFIPFQRNLDDFRRITEDSNAEYLFFHQGISGFDYGNGFIAENEAPLEALKGFKLAVGGHFHKFQTKDNLLYLGSPFSHNFGESNQIKYLGIFDDETGEMELIKTDFPKHMTTVLDLNLNVNLQVDYYDHNRVILKGTREQIELFDKNKYPEIKFIEEEQAINNILILRETETPESLFRTWFTDVKKETNQDILQLGLRLLKEINNGNA
jgi:hypothetical protein